MYNGDLKNKFIKEYTTSISSRDLCVYTFNLTSKYETIWGADLCTVEAEKLRPMVLKLTSVKTSSQNVRLRIVREYVKWCVKNNIPGSCMEIFSVTTDNIEKIKQQTISSPDDLQNYLDLICMPESEHSADDMYRVFYWLAYCGMKEEDILNVRTSDIDIENLKLNYDGKNYKLYSQCVDALENCMFLTSFYYYHPNYSDGKILRDRVVSDKVVRGFRSLPTVMSMRVELSRRQKKCKDEGITNKQLSYNRVYQSGVYYKMFLAEQLDIDPDFEYYARDTLREEGSEISEHLVSKRIVFLQKDYELWKLTFI